MKSPVLVSVLDLVCGLVCHQWLT